MKVFQPKYLISRGCDRRRGDRDGGNYKVEIRSTGRDPCDQTGWRAQRSTTAGHAATALYLLSLTLYSYSSPRRAKQRPMPGKGLDRGETALDVDCPVRQAR